MDLMSFTDTNSKYETDIILNSNCNHCTNVMEEYEDEIVTIHIDTPEGKTVSKIDVPLSELVKCYMDVHFPLRDNKYNN